MGRPGSCWRKLQQASTSLGWDKPPQLWGLGLKPVGRLKHLPKGVAE
ncbi:MAG: hypothetical protein QXR44_02835 [Thermoproteota archaeon]